MTSIKAEAALLSGVDMAQTKIVDGLLVCRPFERLMCPTPLATWHHVFEIAGGERGWEPPACDFPADFVTETQHIKQRVHVCGMIVLELPSWDQMLPPRKAATARLVCSALPTALRLLGRQKCPEHGGLV